MVSAYEALLDTTAARLGSLNTDAAAEVRDASRCPAPLLPHLAWSRGLDYWGSGWPEDVKRELIRQTPANLRRRGTRAAIDAAIGAFDTEIDIREWWEEEPHGAPGTAVASVEADSPIGKIVGGQEALRSILEREGRASVHWTLLIGQHALGALRLTGAARVGVLVQLGGTQGGA